METVDDAGITTFLAEAVTVAPVQVLRPVPRPAAARCWLRFRVAESAKTDCPQQQAASGGICLAALAVSVPAKFCVHATSQLLCWRPSLERKLTAQTAAPDC